MYRDAESVPAVEVRPCSTSVGRLECPQGAGIRKSIGSTLRLGWAAVALGSLVHLDFQTSAAAAAKSASQERVADTQFSVRRGFFREPFELTITTRTAGATIYFTTNASLPSPQNGSAYHAPLRIASTTVLRAAAFKEGLAPSDTDTQTYFFLDQVGHQTGAGFPTTWGLNSGQPVPADYVMDPEIVGHPAYRPALVPALESLPSLSLVATPEDLFDTARGLYANPRESGDAWERPSSVEFFPTHRSKGFHLDCGLRIQGGWNRRPEESPKHAFRLVFRKRYGRGSLEYPLFAEDGGPATFDTLILRAGCNNTWLHWSGEERKRGEYLRDQWMRDSLRAMGHPSARGLFVHLYLNGLYWGLYNLCERPSAPFVAANLGGQPSDYDVRNGSHLLEGDDAGWKQLMKRVEGGVKEPAAYAALGPWLDRTQFVDFFILNLYGANGDWDGASNWYAARRRQPAGPFQFFVWDGERTLEGLEANALDFDAEDSPPRIFQRLRASGEFRQLFAERAHRHLTGDGALAPGPAAARYERWSKLIENAVIAESARWGDYRRDAHPYKTGPYELYTRDDHWRPEVRRLLNDYFPKRTAEVIRQFREANLW